MNFVFLGPPGAGKGTMASRLAEHLSIPHISTGDIIRGAIRDKTQLGLQVKEIVESGGLVPDDLTIELVKERLAADDVKDGYILDGFPRTIAQADSLKEFSKVDSVINFLLADEEIIKRLSGRRIHKPSGRTYHIDFNPPKVPGKDDVTGEDLITRPDDEVGSIKTRLSVYAEQTEPLIDYYKKEKLLIDLDSSPAPDLVFADLKKLAE